MIKKQFLNLYLFVFVAILLAFFVSIIHVSESKKSTITFVSSVPLSGPARELGIEYSSGIDSYFKYTNDSGILKDQNISFEVYDDNYEPYLTRTNITKAIKNRDIYGILGVVGTPTAEEAMKISISKNLPFLMPFSGAEFMYSKDYKNAFALRPSYKMEASKIVDYMVSKGIKKVAIVYQNDSFGLNALKAFNTAIKGSTVELVSEGVYNRNTLSVNYAFNEIKNSKPQAVIIAGTHNPAIGLVKKMQSCNPKCLFFSFSFAGYELLQAEALKKGVNVHNIFIAQVVPPIFIRTKSVVEFEEIYKRYYPKREPSSIAYEGFLVGKVVSTTLVNSTHKNKYGFIDTLSHLNINLLGDRNLTYSKDYHSGLKDVYLLSLDNGKSTTAHE